MTRGRRFTVCLLFVATFVVMASHGSCPATTVELVPCDASNYRWRDIAANLYAASYQDDYTYQDAGVTVTFEYCLDSTFTGHLAASNLKPNFAYQLKLVGKPEAVWGSDGDDETNERIGYAGRWWRMTPNPGNSNDEDYEAHKDDPEYIYEGYLLFDFFITERLGTAAVDFASESSYHVLWWEHQRTSGPCDSPTRWHTVIGYATDPAYDGDVGPTDIGVYGEIERLCFGETALPAGSYNCRLALTEESFHQTGEGEGAWATVMVCDTMAFEMGSPARIGPAAVCSPAVVSPMYPNPFRDRSTVVLRLTKPGAVSVSLYDIGGRLVRCLRVESVPAGEHDLGWDGRDADGNRVTEGVYIYRVEVRDRKVASGKVVLIE